MIDLTGHVRPGDGVAWSQAGAEPTPLLHALLQQLPQVGPIGAFCGLSWDERLAKGPHDGMALRSFGVLGTLGPLADAGALEVIPAHYSSLPRLFAERRLPGDVVLVQVSPADDDGRHSLGIGVDYIADALPHARSVIAEVNACMPTTKGGPRVAAADLDAVVETDRPLLEAPPATVGEVERRIAEHVAALVADGDTLQLGVGALPAAVLRELRGHQDLGLHSGMIADEVLDLVECGALTGARKEIDAGLAVSGAALGSHRLYKACGEDPFRFRPASYTHAPATLARLRHLVAINGAFQVDLTGQVNAEVVRGRQRGAVGGQVDFSRAAAGGGGRSIIALRSVDRRGESCIVPSLDDGLVTTPRSDVDYVVTEHGAAELRGKGARARARALADVAHPDHREALRARADC